jgi:hypothetical protein
MAFAVVVGLAVGAASGQPALPENRPASAQALLDAQSKDVVEDLMSDRMVLVQGENPKPGLVEALVLFSQPVEKVWEL